MTSVVYGCFKRQTCREKEQEQTVRALSATLSTSDAVAVRKFVAGKSLVKFYARFGMLTSSRDRSEALLAKRYSSAEAEHSLGAS